LTHDVCYPVIKKKRKNEKQPGQGVRKGVCEMLGLKKIGGETVGKGTYWNFSTGERVNIEGRGVLPGDVSQSYYKFRPAVILLAGPVLGLVYAVFLPFIGIAMLATVLSKKLFSGALHTAQMGAGFSWNPSEAYLTGKKNRAKKAEKKTEDIKKE
jgi:hypothetical protein